MDTGLLTAEHLPWDPFFLNIFPNLKFPAKLYEVPQSLDLESSLISLELLWAEETRKAKPSLLKCFFKLFWRQFAFFSVLHLFNFLLKPYMAVLIKLLIDDLSKTENNNSWYLAIGIVFCAMSMSVLKSFPEYRLILLSGRIRSLIILMVNKKIMKMNYSSADIGKILNIAGAEIEIFDYLVFVPCLFATPFIILNSSLIISYLAGGSCLVGTGISIIHIPVVLGICIVIARKRNNCNLISDKRVQLVKNFIEGIRVFKYYAWEMKFLKKIKAIRKKEVGLRFKIANISAFNTVCAFCGISLCVFFTFYVRLTFTTTSISLSQMYLIITIFVSNHLQLVYNNAIAILNSILIKTTMARVSNILLLPEYENPQIPKEKNSAISFKSCAFSPKKPEESNYLLETENGRENTSDHLIQNISFSLSKSEICILIGQVGSGKSVLLQSILNEFYLTEGQYSVSGAVSYASEVPWIISGTIRFNILMGLPFDKTRYDQVVYSCSLQDDFSQFVNSDETWIGDRGATLSGGQKARVNLARALYREFDILLLDDPLSAVDANVASHIFHNCVIECKKRGKTVIVATHQLSFLGNADKVLVMDERTVKYFGKPKDLQKEGKIAELVLNEQKFKEESKKDEQLDSKIYEEKEEEMEESYKFGIVFDYFKGGFQRFFFFFIAVLLLGAMHLFGQAQIYWSAHRTDVNDSEYFLNGLGVLTILYYSTAILTLVYWTNFIVKCNAKLSNRSLKSVARTKISFFDDNPAGRIINRFSKDLSNCDGPLHFYIIDCLTLACLVFTSIIVQLIISPIVVLSIPFYLSVIFYIMFKVSKIVAQFRKKESLSRAPILSCLVSNLEGLLTIRAQRSESFLLNEIRVRVENYYRCFFTYQSFLRFSQLYCDFAGLLIISVNLTVILNYKDRLDIRLIAYSLSISLNLVAISSNSFKYIFEVMSLFSSVQRLSEFQSLPQEPLTHDSEFLITSGRIDCKNLTFRYQDTLPLALNDLCFSISAGEKIGIVGRTGSGKSSILYTLFRLGDPERGTFFIDGQDYKNAGLHKLRSQISIIPQSATLFSTSLRDNLDPFGVFSENEIWKALKLVQLDSFFRLQKDELDVKLDGSEVKLSAGQRQLVCIARAILARNKIVVMDEATSNIDIKTDELIQGIMRKEFRGATMLIIAHRILTAADSNRIIVMDNGRCVEFDRPIELYKDKNSMFYQLCEKSGVDISDF